MGGNSNYEIKLLGSLMAIYHAIMEYKSGKDIEISAPSELEFVR
jgi:hypothetical protein